MRQAYSQSRNENDSLKRILGDDTYKALDSFANDLIMLGDAGKEGSIAAGGMWSRMFSHPLNVLGRVSKFKAMAAMFSNPQNIKKAKPNSLMINQGAASSRPVI